MDYSFINEDSNDYNDEAVVAILQRSGVRVTFIAVDDDLINEDYDCMSWFDNEMVIGIAETYLTDVLDESIAEDIADEIHKLDSFPPPKEMEELSMKVLTTYLKNIAAVVMATRDPEESSLDALLDRILEED
jgi:hypothetical protein